MARIPKEVETKVVRKLYADAKSLDWEHQTPQQHSAQYLKWIQDPEVGGRLLEYLTAEDARVWIKDTPMKERRRALSGVGKYADLVQDPGATPEKIVKKALGAGWTPRPGPVQSKPLRVMASNDQDEETVVAWAPASGLKHLVWAALVASTKSDPRPWVLCVVGTFAKPTPTNEKLAHQRLAKRCDLRIEHLNL